jgi:hypothetical protein
MGTLAAKRDLLELFATPGPSQDKCMQMECEELEKNVWVSLKQGNCFCSKKDR